MKNLNPEQLAAVTHGTGPLLIVAGAGTGKTTVVVERVLHLISKEHADPQKILALTFTEKAAKEMQDRIDEALPLGYANMWISTFHSFCDRVLRAEALEIGLDPHYRLLTTSELTHFVKSHLFEFELDYYRPMANPYRFLVALLTHFSRLQDEDISPEAYRTWAHNLPEGSEESDLEKKKYMELSNAYTTYQSLKEASGVLDYSDLIAKTLYLFRTRKNILTRYQNQFSYVLVDEFQDTNFAQSELSYMLAGKDSNITVCGDDDQSIYRFRGAAVSNILQFKRQYPTAAVVTLTKNYRSSQRILDAAYALITHNNPDRLEVIEKIDKKLVSQVTVKDTDVTFIPSFHEGDEVESVVKKILELSSQYSFSDIALLVRANSHTEPFLKAFDFAGIPYTVFGKTKLLSVPEIAQLVSYLKLLTDVSDSVSFLHILSFPLFAVPGQDIALLGAHAKSHNVSLYEAALTCGDKLSEDARMTVNTILSLVHADMKRIQTDSAGQILYQFLESSGLLSKLLSNEDAGGLLLAQRIGQLFEVLKSYESNHKDATVGPVVEWLTIAEDIGDAVSMGADEPTSEGVNVMTVHGAKGLEFPVVIMPNLVSQRFPTTEKGDLIPVPDVLLKEVIPSGDAHLQEERRLFYVGMTRSKEKLIFTGAQYYGDGKRQKKLSPFVSEALGEKTLVSEKAQKTIASHTPQSQTTAHETLSITYLSYSQIEAFRVCPLHYKLGHILKIPQKPSASKSFGISVHSALQRYVQDIIDKKDPDKEALFTYFKEVWIPVGYETKKHEQEFFEKGKLYLEGYLAKKSVYTPIAVETKYELTLPHVPGEKPLKIGGVIDRIDTNSGGIEIIDYKTGATIPSQKEVDANLQLTIYALAATHLVAAPFARKPEELTLSLYYLDTQEKLSTHRTAAQLEAAIVELYAVRKEIEGSTFNCSGSFLCGNCEYKSFCRQGES